MSKLWLASWHRRQSTHGASSKDLDDISKFVHESCKSSRLKKNMTRSLVLRTATMPVVCSLERVQAGRHCLKSSSTVQSTIALSSGESEFYLIVKAASAGLGLRALYHEWRIPVKVVVRSDSWYVFQEGSR